ncbi:hypothetical protein Trydic_g11821 [Trypoxylus dichotomus]
MAIFKFIVLPMAFYGQEIWIKGSPKAMQTMKWTQLFVSRKCTGALWFTMNKELTEELKLEDVEKTALSRRQYAIDIMRTKTSRQTPRRGPTPPTLRPSSWDDGENVTI